MSDTPMITGIREIIEKTSFTFRLVVGLVAMVAGVSAFYVKTRDLVAMPTTLAKHDSVMKANLTTLDKMLCINVADHRKIDWRLCYIDPSQVIPKDGPH